MTDQNGETCALIKVETTVDGFSWDVGSLGIVDAKRVGGEIWVYVPFGVRRITVSHPDFGVIRDYAFPRPLERARTYILKLNTLPGSLTYDASRKQKLILTVRPANAEILINGMSFHPDKNGILTQEIACGIHALTVISPKYHPVQKMLSVKESENPVRETIILKQAFGWLGVRSSEPLSIEIDGSQLSYSPGRDLEVLSGHHQLTVKRAWYKPYQCTVEIKDSTRFELVPNFVPNFRELEFVVDEGTGIWIDGEQKGTWKWKGRVEYGTHSIECRKAGHRTTFRTVTVDEFSLGPIALEAPQPVYGTLHCTSTPDDAVVTIDGKYAGHTPGDFRVLIGNHTVEIKKTGHNSVRHSVTIFENQTYSVNDRLTNIMSVTIKTSPSDAEVYVDGNRRQSKTMDLEVGTHSIQLFSRGYLDYSDRFEVTDSDKEYHFKMQKKYYDRSSLYFGALAGCSVTDYMAGAYLGLYLGGINLEVAFLSGMSDIACSGDNYRPLLYEGRIGYGFVIGNRVRLTPRVGASYLYLSRNGSKKSSKGFNPESSDAYSFVSDLKFNIALGNCFEISIVPEYDIPTRKSDTFNTLYETSPKVGSWVEGFKVSVGLGIFF